MIKKGWKKGSNVERDDKIRHEKINNPDITLQELGVKYELSRERIRQICSGPKKVESTILYPHEPLERVYARLDMVNAANLYSRFDWSVYKIANLTGTSLCRVKRYLKELGHSK